MNGPGGVALLLSILVLVAAAAGFAVVAGVLRYRNARKEREWRERERRWERPVLDVLSGALSVDRVGELVEPDEGLYFVDFLLRFARRTRGSTRDILAELAAPYLPPLVERMSGGDPERRARAVETVALLGFEAHAERILDALADPSPLVAMIAARAIARGRRAEHVEALLAHASLLSDWSPRQIAAVLATMGPDAMPALRRVLVDPTRPPLLRAAAADALTQLHDPAGVDAAAIVLAGCNDREVTTAALRLFAELGRPEHAPHVRPFGKHEDPIIRSAALHALARTGTPQDRALLKAGLDDESRWVAIHAARGLQRRGGGEALRLLAQEEGPRSVLARQVLLERA